MIFLILIIVCDQQGNQLTQQARNWWRETWNERPEAVWHVWWQQIRFGQLWTFSDSEIIEVLERVTGFYYMDDKNKQSDKNRVEERI